MDIDKAPVRRLVRVIGPIVVLAGLVTTFLALQFASAPLRVSGIHFLVMLVSSFVSTVGALWLLITTRNFFWAFSLFPVVGIVVVWVLVAQMSPVNFH